VTLDQLTELSEEARAAWLLPPDSLLQSLPAVYLEDQVGRRFAFGNPVSIAAPPGRCRVYCRDHLLGLGEVDGTGNLQPRRVVGAQPAGATSEGQQ
jgi:hypothetical protein